jgi:hypothetical protein
VAARSIQAAALVVLLVERLELTWLVLKWPERLARLLAMPVESAERLVELAALAGRRLALKLRLVQLVQARLA